jgi:predicted membrane protein
MEILSSRVFWGAVIILLGLSIILNAVFRINFPFLKVLFSLIIIYIGFSLLLGSFGRKGVRFSGNETSSVFGNAHILVDEANLARKYSTVFGSQVIDLTELNPTSDQNISFDAVFGSQRVIVPKRQKVRIKGSSAFGSVRLPSGGDVVFGDQIYTHEGDSGSTYTLHIDGDAVFGSIRFDLR